jgi:hypothetical protein
MLRILRWNVLVRYDPGRFFKPVTVDRYVSGITYSITDRASVPVFTSDTPVLYTFRDSRFVQRELRRVGYNAYRLPWIFFAFRMYRLRKKSSRWK